MNRRGRPPKTIDKRTKSIRIRLTEEEFNRLSELSEKYGLTKSNLLRSILCKEVI